jgi:hypothetical protein
MGFLWCIFTPHLLKSWWWVKAEAFYDKEVTSVQAAAQAWQRCFWTTGSLLEFGNGLIPFYITYLHSRYNTTTLPLLSSPFTKKMQEVLLPTVFGMLVVPCKGLLLHLNVCTTVQCCKQQTFFSKIYPWNMANSGRNEVYENFILFVRYTPPPMGKRMPHLAIHVSLSLNSALLLFWHQLASCTSQNTPASV